MPERESRYYLDQEGRFVVEEYNWAAPFSNFFPGIAGQWGIPLWVYWVSRAQAVCSVGVRDKDHQILEFMSFNRACQSVPHEGFRTFVRLAGAAPMEPFQRTARRSVQQRLLMAAGELELEETDAEHGLETHVAFFPLVNLPVAGLVRQVTLRNRGAQPVALECLDGLPRVLPYGLDQHHIKLVARHVEAMMGVDRVDGIPIFRLKQTASDSEAVDLIRGGTFYLSLMHGTPVTRDLIDPAVLFGDPMQHLTPWRFHDHGLDDLLTARQLTENTTPCAFTGCAATLAPGESVTLTSVLGHVTRDAHLRRFAAQVARPGFLDDKRHEGRLVLEEITSKTFTASAAPTFDRYCGQDFLDNAMRGGLPVTFSGPDGRKVFYVYCRQNGDLERDYHYFVLEPTYLSQGTGHYRSIFQNRRTDVWFFPETEDANIVWFMNLLQLDGYNPLEVRGRTYTTTRTDDARRVIGEAVPDDDLAGALVEMIQRPFTPGELAMRLEEGGLSAAEVAAPLLGALLPICEEHELGGLHEGFWVDHWLYNLDAIELFLMIYPDRLRSLLLEQARYTFFDDPDVVLPRSQKSVRRPDGAIRRYGAVRRDPEKVARAKARSKHAYRVRAHHGEGEVYQTTLLVKLLGLLANRIATLDPAGVGVDMEADKPGWNDSMNGLPGLFGSSLCETLELEKLARFLAESLAALGDFALPVYEELVDLMAGLQAALDERLGSADPDRALRFWDQSNTLKERYRERTRLGVSGVERSVAATEIRRFVDSCHLLLRRLFTTEEARRAVMDADGVPYTYFVNEVTAHEPGDGEGPRGYPLVRPTRFTQRPVPLFLEGPMHYLKVHPEQARGVYEAVRRSPLFDQSLQMYRSCVDVSGETFELGRAVGAYPRGWLENESVYLHMEYKYLLEILRSGLCDEFFRDIRTALVPFMDPAVYGRSTLEGASFIVSSAYADPALHGRGFQPRLSGITCEMLHIWILMVAGPRPFFLGDDGALRLGLRPALADWLFTTEPQRRAYVDEAQGPTEIELPADTFAFKLIGSTLVVYHNPTRGRTYGPDGVSPSAHRLSYRDGREVTVRGDHLGPDEAAAVRGGKMARIDVVLSPSR